jgi:signal transduction histidine kinase
MIRIVTKRSGSGAACVSIEDTGSGIDLAKLNAIFDVFVTTKKHGMGLGLPLCRMIIEQHGGHISVSSELDKGTRFEFEVPVVHEVDQPSTAAQHKRGRADALSH